MQISSHAQKYFHRMENIARRQRSSINDIVLHDDEPRVQSNDSSLQRFTFTSGTYNPNHYGSSSQFVAMSNIAKHMWFPSVCCIDQESTSNNQITTLDRGGSGGSCVALEVQGVGSKAKLISD
jgi:hypothetical protein